MKGNQSTTVSTKTKQVEETCNQWLWVEPSVWTERMLTTLDKGVKGGKWFSLIDKVYSTQNLVSAFKQVSSNKGAAGVDHQTLSMFEAHLDKRLDHISEQLRCNRYHPRSIRRVYIPKAGSKEPRPLGIPTVRDRVVQTALRNVIEPIFEKQFAPHSYGFRPGKGCKDALRRVNQLLKEGYVHVVDADLRSYFDTIPHDKLLNRVREQISDGRVLCLIEQYLQQNVMDVTGEWTPENGTPQGAVISPLLSNIYLNPLDHLLSKDGYEMVRYADDFVILCRSAEQAINALDIVQKWTQAQGLALHPEKTCIVDATLRGGFDFLGYHFERGFKWPSKKSVAKLKDAVRKETRRANGQSLEAIISNLNRSLPGWFEYFKHGHYTSFGRIDGWIRMRLRSILRKRQRRRGVGRGLDHFRWPNSYFADRGLFSLVTAYDNACQSDVR